MKTFKAPEFSGIWLPFTEDRMAFRAMIETHLQKEFQDPNGKLVVAENGPHWKSELRLELSYSHTKGIGVLVYSTTHQLGVDIESEEREFNTDPMKLAARFFPRAEVSILEKLPLSEQKRAFLDLWVQKEAYAKLTRLGLAKTLELGVIPSVTLKAKSLPVFPNGILSCIFMG